MIQKGVPTAAWRIWIAGDAAVARQVCREYCMTVGLCVTVTPTDFIYTGGQEAGVVVGLLNYPRFPDKPPALAEKAMQLAGRLRAALCQHSVLVEGPDITTWISEREQA
jgi:ferredoxin